MYGRKMLKASLLKQQLTNSNANHVKCIKWREGFPLELPPPPADGSMISDIYPPSESVASTSVSQIFEKVATEIIEYKRKRNTKASENNTATSAKTTASKKEEIVPKGILISERLDHSPDRTSIEEKQEQIQEKHISCCGVEEILSPDSSDSIAVTKYYINFQKDPPFLYKDWISDKIHWGVRVNRDVKRGEFLAEYRGKLLQGTATSSVKEQEYVYDFWAKIPGQRENRLCSIDATSDDGSMARLINDSHRGENARTQVVIVKMTPHLCIFAKKAIRRNEEIRYNYGENIDFEWRVAKTVDSQKAASSKKAVSLEKGVAFANAVTMEKAASEKNDASENNINSQKAGSSKKAEPLEKDDASENSITTEKAVSENNVSSEKAVDSQKAASSKKAATLEKNGASENAGRCLSTSQLALNCQKRKVSDAIKTGATAAVSKPPDVVIGQPVTKSTMNQSQNILNTGGQLKIGQRRLVQKKNRRPGEYLESRNHDSEVSEDVLSGDNSFRDCPFSINEYLGSDSDLLEKSSSDSAATIDQVCLLPQKEVDDEIVENSAQSEDGSIITKANVITTEKATSESNVASEHNVNSQKAASSKKAEALEKGVASANAVTTEKAATEKNVASENNINSQKAASSKKAAALEKGGASENAGRCLSTSQLASNRQKRKLSDAIKTGATAAVSKPPDVVKVQPLTRSQILNTGGQLKIGQRRLVQKQNRRLGKYLESRNQDSEVREDVSSGEDSVRDPPFNINEYLGSDSDLLEKSSSDSAATIDQVCLLPQNEVDDEIVENSAQSEDGSIIMPFLMTKAKGITSEKAASESNVTSENNINSQKAASSKKAAALEKGGASENAGRCLSTSQLASNRQKRKLSDSIKTGATAAVRKPQDVVKGQPLTRSQILNTGEQLKIGQRRLVQKQNRRLGKHLESRNQDSEVREDVSSGEDSVRDPPFNINEYLGSDSDLLEKSSSDSAATTDQVCLLPQKQVDNEIVQNSAQSEDGSIIMPVITTKAKGKSPCRKLTQIRNNKKLRIIAPKPTAQVQNQDFSSISVKMWQGLIAPKPTAQVQNQDFSSISVEMWQAYFCNLRQQLPWIPPPSFVGPGIIHQSGASQIPVMMSQISLIANQISPFMSQNLVVSIPDTAVPPVVSTPDTAVPDDNDEAYGVCVNGEPKIGCKRRYDRKNFCVYCCKELTTKIGRHLMFVHGDEERVDSIRMLSKEKRAIFLHQLINEGNFKHNLKVLKERKGFLVVARRTRLDGTIRAPEDYVPCEFCMKFCVGEQLWHHISQCPVRKYLKIQPDNDSNDAENDDDSNGGENKEEDNTRSTQHLKKSRFLLRSAMSGEDENYFENLMARINNGEVKNLIQSDPLIHRYAAILGESLGDQSLQKRRDAHVSSNSVRSVARLLLHIRKTNSALESCTADEMLTPQKFDIVVKAAKELSIGDTKGITFGKSIRHYIAHLIEVKSGFGIRLDCGTMIEEARGFKVLFDMEWLRRVTRVLDRMKALVDIVKPNEIPLTEDLVKFRDYLLQRIEVLTNRLDGETEVSAATWTDLCSVALCRLLLFNKRRVTEVADLKVNTYVNRPKWCESNDEFNKALTPVEKNLAKRMDLVVVLGKSRKNIEAFILIPPDCQRALNRLLDTRGAVGISKSNPYLFARLNADTPLSGTADMKQMRSECPLLAHPERITTRYLRKYIATISQILDMTEGELSMLATHLGHDVKTHKEYYRLSSSTVELTKVTRLLLAVESGTVNDWKDKHLSEIRTEELPPLEADTIDDDDTVPMLANNDDAEDIENSDSDSIEQKQIRKGVKRRWTLEETDAFTRHFQQHVCDKRMATGEELQAARASTLIHRSIPQIRTRLHNMIKSKLKFTM